MELNFHHIGGRWGTIPPIETWGKFYGMLNITLYEPDDRSYQQIQRLDLKRARGYKSVSLVPLCIGSEDGESDLHLCFDRNASSIHPFNPAYADWGFFAKKFDRGFYKLGIANTAGNKVRISCRALDSLKSEGQISQPDMLSIDAEGASMDILEGAPRILENTLGIFMEGAIIPTHQGEAPFSDILRFLRDKSFLWISIGSEVRLSVTEMPIGVYDCGIVHGFEDAVFIKDPHAVDNAESLLKLSLIALLCGCTSVAHICFQKLDSLSFDFNAMEAGGALPEFYRKYKELKGLLLPKINETHTEEVYNIGSYVVNRSEIEKGVEEAQAIHRRDSLQRYVPLLVKALEKFRKDGGIISTIYRKYGLDKFAESSSAAEKEQLEFLMRLLQQTGLVSIKS